jgi:hypothetical protein
LNTNDYFFNSYTTYCKLAIIISIIGTSFSIPWSFLRLEWDGGGVGWGGVA